MHEPIAERGRRFRFAAGDILFHEGDATNGCYILVTGQLKVYAASEHGREMVFAILEPGELVGELSLDGSPRSASVRAVTDVECVLFKNSAIRELMRVRPEFADYVVAKLVSRARHCTRQTRSIALEDVPERVVGLLEAAAVTRDGVRHIPSVLTQQEIADRIGASREMVHRVIGNLVRNGYLAKDSRHRMKISGALNRRVFKTSRA
jgi:CRP/FNR family cyclic AMP-dependent transcriptional regulator